MRAASAARHVVRAFVFATLLGLRAAAQTTLVDDVFVDGNRTGQTPPVSVNWLANTGSGLTSATSVAGLQLNNTASRLLVGYFTASGAPATVSVGQSIALEITFVSDVTPASVTNGFNIALCNSSGARVAADFSGTSNAAFTNYDGYGSKTGGLGSTSGSAITLRRRNAATRSTALMSTSGDWSTLATASGTTPVAAANTTYVATVTVANNGATAAITYSVKTADGLTTLHSLSGNDTNAAGVLSAFDSVVLYAQTNEFPAGTVTLKRVRVFLSGGGVPPTAPSFTTQPASQSANVGGSVTFTAAASGTPAPTYQWKKNGTDIAGATGTALALTNVQTSDAGDYAVVATNSVGSTPSATATLTVTTVVIDPPAITVPPASQTVNLGDTASFGVTATGTAPVAYQWRKNGGTLAGATDSVLTLTNVQASAAGSYTVTVSNAAGTVTSAGATLSVTTPPSITAQPLGLATTVGSNVAFSVAAGGSPAPTYQWQKDGTNLPGATNATLTLDNVQLTDAGSYAVVVANSLGSVSSSAAVLTVAVPSPLSRYNLAGFATVGAGTTGGGVIPETDPAYVKVSTPLEFANALIAAAKNAGAVKVIEIVNDLDLGWNEIGANVQSLASNPFRSHAAPKLHPVLIATGVSLIDIKPKSGLTIFSANGATIRHATFNIKGTSNIILRNLKFDELWEWDEATKGNYDSNDWDFVTLSNGSDARNIWIDHCTFTKAYDGIVDMKAGTQYVTLSWCRYLGDDGATNANSFVRRQIAALEANRPAYPFYNFLRTNGFSVEDIVAIVQGHDKGHLLGSNSLDAENATLSATFHHQWFANVWDRCVPRLRAGNVHNYNLYVDDSAVLVAKRLRDARAAALTTSLRNTLNNTYSFNPPINGCISTEGGAVLLENSTYVDCLWPLRNNQTDPSNAIYTGKIMAVDSRYVFHNADGTVVSVRGNSTDAGSPMGPFQAPTIPFSWSGFSALPYSYHADDPDALPQMLAIGAGAGALTWSKENWLKTIYAEPASPPEITQQPQSQTAVAGTSVAFTVAATGTAPLAYAWRKNGVAMAGATGDTLSIATVAPDDGADYSVVITNLVGSATSDVAHLTVLVPPSVTAPPSQTATVGDTVSFSVVASGTAPLALQWRKDGAPLSGQTSATLTLSNVLTSAAGGYSVTVTNSVGTVTSDTAVLLVNQAVASVALTGLNVVYDGTAKVATATTVPAGLPVDLTYDGSPTAPVDAGTYTVSAAIADENYTGSATGTLEIARAVAQVTLSGLTQVYDGTPKTAVATTEPNGLAVTLAYNGNSTAPTNAGTYAVHGVVDTRNYIGAADGALRILPANATIMLAPLQQRYDGTPRTVNATTQPSGLGVVVNYGGATAPTLPGSYAIGASIADSNYVGTVAATLVISATVLVRHAPSVASEVDGSMQVATGEDIDLGGGATMTGDLLVPGLPEVTRGGHAMLVGVQDATGATAPSAYEVALRGNALLRYVVRRVNAVVFPTVALPAAPGGTRDVRLTTSRSTIGDWATVRDVAVSSGYGQLVMPPGGYGDVEVDGATIILGIAGSSQPVSYDLQSLRLNGGRLVVVGPVTLTVAHGVRCSGTIGAVDRVDWLSLRIASGGLVLDGSGELNANVTAPTSPVDLSGASRANGTIVAGRFSISGHAQLTDPRP